MPDPRKGEDFDSVNKFLRDQAVRHRIGLERTAGSIRKDAISLLNESDDDIEQRLQYRLQRGLSEGAARPRQLQDLRREIQEINGEVMKDVDGKLKDRMKELSTSEAQMTRDRVQKAIPVDVDANLPGENQLISLVATNPMQGKTLSQWTDKVGRDRTQKVMNAVRNGITEGDSNQEIVSRVLGTRQFGYKDGVLNQTRNNVASITRTAVTEVSSSARELTYQRNSQVVKGVQYVATLDSRTTIQCAALDGREFEIGQGPRPPVHFACRSTTAPLTKSWREMGFNRSDFQDTTRASSGSGLKMDGQVPATNDFESWLHQQPGDVRDEILGSTRRELWEKGDFELQDFLKNGIKQDTELWSIEELRRRNQEAFEKIAS